MIQRIAAIKKILDEHFPDPPICLQHTSVYTLLIAVLLSAQSTDARVNQVTPLLFAQAATPQEMVALPVETIEAIIRPCGLSRNKSRFIHALSQMLLQEYGGEVPDALEELERLPGVGHKTASVVLSQAFGKPAFPVDTHIYRLSHRWGLSEGTTVSHVEADLKKIFDEKDWGRVHLQMIYYARAYCPARGHRMEACPICSLLKGHYSL